MQVDCTDVSLATADLLKYPAPEQGSAAGTIELHTLHLNRVLVTNSTLKQLMGIVHTSYNYVQSPRQILRRPNSQQIGSTWCLYSGHSK